MRAAAVVVVLSVAVAAEAPSSLTVEVSGFRNEKGALGCLLFSSSDGFPEDAAKAARTQRVPISQGKATCRFEGLSPGTYAVMALHDENGNGKADKNFLGIPSEGYGVSKNVTSALSPPKWAEAHFELAGGRAETLQVSLRY